MKRFFILICLLFACNLLFAKEKKDKVIYEKKYDVSFLGFYESTDLEKTNDYKYYIAIYDYMQDDETIAYEIFCNDYEKIKDYFYKVREKGLNFKKPYFHFYVDACITNLEYAKFLKNFTDVVNIKEVYKNKDFSTNKKTIIDFHVFVLE